jgi:hypothetical protein
MPSLRALWWTIVVGILLGAIATLSPLTILVVTLAVATIAYARRDLPADEAAWVTGLLVAALVARALAIVALNVASVPGQNDQWPAMLFGDEAYALARAARTRDVVLGLPVTRLDYIVMFDSYARTGYTTFLNWIQVMFGSSPYAVRLMNGVLFTAGAALLYRVVRVGFGAVPSLVALATLLFLPSLFLFSISVLKESAYFLLSAAMLAAVVAIVRAGSWPLRAAWMAVFLFCLRVVADLRPGAVVLTGGALVLGAIASWLLGARWRIAIAAVALVVAGVVLVRSSAAVERVRGALVMTAKQHTGHAFTVGHAYKTLDDSFYEDVRTPAASTLTLTAAQAARYIARSTYAFLTVPCPWQVVTRSEAVFIPEQVVWYVLVLAALAGLVPAWRRDPFVTALLVAAILPTAAVVALTTGNVGTLVRLRGLVMPFLVWLGAVGGTVALERAGVAVVDDEGRVFGRVNLVDALCVAFVVGLVPIAYASMLLFRSPKPHLRSVERAEVNREDRRIANGLEIQQKLKLRGDHFTPVLRAFIDDVPAIGFAFEDPTSADVIVGNIPLGTHDLILYDGVQEVARLRGAVTRQAKPGARARVVGALIQLDRATADGLQSGQRYLVNGEPVAEFLTLGAVEPDRHPIKVPNGTIEAPVSGSWSRSVVMRVVCDPDPNEALCRVGTATLGDAALKVMDVPGAPRQLRVLIADIVPDDAPHSATVRIRVAADRGVVDRIHVGDREARGEPADERTASVGEIERRGTGDVALVLRLGLDRARDGWHYKTQIVTPGAPFSFVTDRYAVSGHIVSLAIDER